jgi:hypothetical protein
MSRESSSLALPFSSNRQDGIASGLCKLASHGSAQRGSAALTCLSANHAAEPPGIAHWPERNLDKLGNYAPLQGKGQTRSMVFERIQLLSLSFKNFMSSRTTERVLV